jgi:hypothetical protein
MCKDGGNRLGRSLVTSVRVGTLPYFVWPFSLFSHSFVPSIPLPACSLQLRAQLCTSRLARWRRSHPLR